MEKERETLGGSTLAMWCAHIGNDLRSRYGATEGERAGAEDFFHLSTILKPLGCLAKHGSSSSSSSVLWGLVDVCWCSKQQDSA